LLQSATSLNFQVNQPTSKEEILFSKLCVSGGIVNTYDAVKRALELTEK